MRTSISSSCRAAGMRLLAQRGFTLVEILVVVLLIGLTVALVTVKLQRDDRQIVNDEARRLAALLAQARDEAITTGASLGWRGAINGYAFLRRGAERNWQPFTEGEVFRKRVLPDAMQFAAIEIAGRTAGSEEVLVFSSTGVVPAFRMILAYGAERVSVTADNPARIRVERLQ